MKMIGWSQNYHCFERIVSRSLLDSLAVGMGWIEERNETGVVGD
jgi:hypothetical protein